MYVCYVVDSVTTYDSFIITADLTLGTVMLHEILLLISKVRTQSPIVIFGPPTYGNLKVTCPTFSANLHQTK